MYATPKTWIAAAALAAAWPASATAMPERLRAMTPEAFAALVEREEDIAGGRLTLSTRPGFVRHRRSPIRHLLSDNHLRAVIDRPGGAVRYEVHQTIFHWGRRRSYVAVHAAAPVESLRPGRIDTRAAERFCPNEDDWGQCARSISIAFTITAEELRSIAARYRPGGSSLWTYRLEEAGGRHWRAGISPAEAAGLLLAAERHQGFERLPAAS